MSFKDKYKVNDAGCWIWQGYKNPKGYGQLTYEGKVYRAHRLSYQMHTGVDPKGKCVLHKCDTPSCVNPRCLFLGTNQDNVDDKVSKGRQSRKKINVKLGEQEVVAIREILKRHPVYGIATFLGNWFGVDRTAICKIRKGKNWA